MNIYYVDEDQLRQLSELSDSLQSGSDAMRDAGHRLWLVLRQIEGNKVEHLND